MRSRVPALVVCSALSSIAVASGVPSEAAVPGRCSAQWAVAGLPSAGDRQSLYAVSMIPSGPAWAVGSLYTGTRDVALSEQWDGASWRSVRTPALSGDSYLHAVAGAGSDDIWAAGYWIPPHRSEIPLTLHWDGTGWAAISAPTGSRGFSAFAGVTALGGGAAWAVGYRLDSAGHYRTLAERWDGTRWRIVPTPNPGPGDNAFTAVGRDAANRLWAVGYQTSGTVTAPLIERWDGTAWSVVPSADLASASATLFAVASDATGAAWAVGSYNDGSMNRTLIEHWDGAAWTAVPGDDVPASGNVLNAVAATSAGEAWAAGYDYPNGTSDYRPIVEHWDGAAWTRVTDAPWQSSEYEYFDGVAVAAAGLVWTVGDRVGGATAYVRCAGTAPD